MQKDVFTFWKEGGGLLHVFFVLALKYLAIDDRLTDFFYTLKMRKAYSYSITLTNCRHTNIYGYIQVNMSEFI